MKSKFSTSWISSSQPRKQRKYRYNAPFHIRQNLLNANLSKELRKKHGVRSIAIRKGDEALIMRGGFAKKKGKVNDVDLKKLKITIEGINRKKADGTKVNVYIDPSNIQIQSLNLEDSKRLNKQEKAENKQEIKNASNKK